MKKEEISIKIVIMKTNREIMNGNYLKSLNLAENCLPHFDWSVGL
jgi:hypothetical protein